MLSYINIYTYIETEAFLLNVLLKKYKLWIYLFTRSKLTVHSQLVSKKILILFFFESASVTNASEKDKLLFKINRMN